MKVSDAKWIESTTNSCHKLVGYKHKYVIK